MPIGGSSFTKALVKEMKFTFEKAEQEKRNAVRAADPRAVFKAMRPVFTEFASELQRSLNYFTGTDKTATIGRVLLLGNAAKLRGLSDFVAKQLQLDVQRLEKYDALEGPAVSASGFREHRLAFATAYGLALQGAGGAAMATNLLPREIVRDRLIAEKKPWLVAGMLGLLTAAVVNFVGMFLAWQTYAPAKYQQAFAGADNAKARSAAAVSALESSAQKQTEAAAWQRYLIEVRERRFQSLDMLRAVTSMLPRDDRQPPPAAIADRRELQIDSIDMQYFPDLATWFSGVQGNWEETKAAAAPAAADDEPAAQPPPDPATAEQQVAADPASAPPVAEGEPTATPGGPVGPGWVVEITGHHFHNEERGNEGEQFVRGTLVRGLLGEGEGVTVAAGARAGEEVSVADLGIGFPVLVASSPIRQVELVEGGGSPTIGGRPGMEGGPATAAPVTKVKRYDFVLQFVWQPATPGSTLPKPAAAATAMP